MVLSNEVYTGAGLSATLIPEMDLDVGMRYGTKVSGNKKGFRFYDSHTGGTPDYKEISWKNGKIYNNEGAALTDTTRMMANIYQGCMAEVKVYESDFSTERVTGTQYLRIKSNTSDRISFDVALGGTAKDDIVQLKILQYGAPLQAVAEIDDKHNLLSDNWLGLITTFTPPTVDPEMKQLNMALGGTRNFSHQLKGAESFGEASMDMAVNNASWLYYALGTMTWTAPQSGSRTLGSSADNSQVYFDDTNKVFYRRESDVINPPEIFNTDSSTLKKLDNALAINYTISENNKGSLPSFALEVTAEKGSTIGSTAYHQDATDERLFSRVFTGCMVQTLTLNFEEGMELTASVSAVTRKAHDTIEDYVPKRNVRTNTSLFNYNDDDANNPYMFSDGTISMFGQTWARVKSGSLTISNNLTPQRYIGNYDRGIIANYTAGQRTYEVSLTLQVTDRTLWDNLRTKNETNNSTHGLGTLKLEFEKSTTDKFHLEFDDYIVQSVDIPFPDDKGMLDLAVVLSPRTLTGCNYTGKWVIQG